MSKEAGAISSASQLQPAASTSVAIALLAVILVDPVLGEPLPGSLDVSFDAGSIASNGDFDLGRLARIVVQPDQRILIADILAGVNGGQLMGPTLFRLNNDGTQDSGFFPSGFGFSGTDRIGRIFSSAMSTSLVRLDSDGTMDPSFAPVPSDYLPLAAELSDGRIMAAVLRQVDPRTQVETLERLSSTGAVDPGYVIQIASGYPSPYGEMRDL